MAVDLRLFGILTLCFVLLCLGLVVVVRDPRALVNRLFALSMLTMIGGKIVYDRLKDGPVMTGPRATEGQ